MMSQNGASLSFKQVLVKLVKPNYSRVKCDFDLAGRANYETTERTAYGWDQAVRLPELHKHPEALKRRFVPRG